MNWYFLELPALSAAGALLGLDEAHVGQWMVSRPIVVGTLLGAVLGEPRQGAALGAVLELLTIDDLPMGHRIPLNGTVAAATAVLLAAGVFAVDAAVALPTGLLSGHIFRRVENAIRLRRGNAAADVEEAIAKGKRVPFGRTFAKSIAVHAALVAAFLYVVVALLGPVLSAAWPALPPFVRDGVEMTFHASLWLGLAAVLHLLRPR